MSAALRVQPIEQAHPEAGQELDIAVIEACRARDPKALRVWVARYERPVFAFLSRSLGAGPHVEDLAQEVFARAFTALDRFDPNGPARLSTWMLGIARRVAQEQRRKRAIPLLHPADVAKLVHDPGTPDQAHDRRCIAEAFERAAAQLSEDQLDAFLLAEFHGLSMSEIASILEVPESTAKTRLHRAKEKLRKLLTPLREA